MKMFKFAIALPLVCLMVLGFGVSLPNAFAADELVIADFDTGDKPNNIGGDFGDGIRTRTMIPREP